MLVDSHMHTYLCKHAAGSPAEYLQAARKAGLSGMVFTDHAPAPDGYDPQNRMTLSQFDEYRTLIHQLQANAPGYVGFGIEADYYDGCESFLTAWLPQQDFDMVLGSVHYIGDWPFDHPDHIKRWQNSNIRDAWHQYFLLVAQLADSRLFDVLAHPDLPKKFGFRPSEIDIIELATPAFQRIASAGMAIEINTSGLRRAVREAYPTPQLLKLARKLGIPLCFGSDAHDQADVGYAFEHALLLAHDAGYTSFARYKSRKRSQVPLPQPPVGKPNP